MPRPACSTELTEGDVPAGSSPAGLAPAAASHRVLALDAIRGFVMLTMIFVNDLNREAVPWWMKHYSEGNFGPNGMTFVDLVFPAFIFVMGMSIPLAFTGRLTRGVSWWRLAGHVLGRTASLLALGILMVNSEETPNAALMPIRPLLWNGLLYVFAILAFCQIGTPTGRGGRGWGRGINWAARGTGTAGLLYLALVYRFGDDGERLLSLRPLHLHTAWYGILGLIGWAYLVAAIVFFVFRTRRLPILVCIALLYTLFALDQAGGFTAPRLSFISIGQNGTHAAIATAGLLLGTILLTPETAAERARLRFAAWFVAGFIIAALVVAPPLAAFKVAPPLWGISKNEATPAWGMWACAAGGALFLSFYWVADVRRARWLAWPWAVAGRNVLLAYLLSCGLGDWLRLTGGIDGYIALGEPGLTQAVCRSLGCGVVLLLLTTILNRLGFFVRL